MGKAMTSGRPIGRFHVITDEVLQTRFSHAELARLAAEGGADAIQYREKRPLATRELVEAAASVSRDIDGKGAWLVVNDRVDVASVVMADVHLGRDDLDPRAARRLLGSGAVIGGTANGLEEAQRADAAPIDYIGAGPVYGTASKGDRAAPKMGLERLAEIAGAVEKPVIAIGGIQPANVAEVMATGVHGIAVLSAVVCQADPRAAAAEFRAALDAALAERRP